MEPVMYQIFHERPGDDRFIEPLLDKCFGPDRFQKTAYEVRRNIQPIPELSFVTLAGDQLVATIRYWPITIGGQTSAILLGPIAVEPELQGKGIGVRLIRESIRIAEELGHRLIVLVGDPEYYVQFGFRNAAELGFTLPGPVEARRFLVRECVPGALQKVSGMVAGAKAPKEAPGRVARAAETSRLIATLSSFPPPGRT